MLFVLYRFDKTRKPTVHTDPAADVPDPTCTKIYYASRTHSQLSQVLHELEKLKINLSPTSVVSVSSSSQPAHSHLSTPTPTAKRSISSLEDNKEDTLLEDEDLSVDVRVVSLGSRKQLCINEKLKAKAGDLDEACRQLLSGKFCFFLTLFITFIFERTIQSSCYALNRERRQTVSASTSHGGRDTYARLSGSGFGTYMRLR